MLGSRHKYNEIGNMVMSDEAAITGDSEVEQHVYIYCTDIRE
jgi:hypothetical protein